MGWKSIVFFYGSAMWRFCFVVFTSDFDVSWTTALRKFSFVSTFPIACLLFEERADCSIFNYRCIHLNVRTDVIWHFVVYIIKTKEEFWTNSHYTFELRVLLVHT